MTICMIEQETNKYFHDIDDIAKMLGVSRRAIFDLLKKVKIEPLDRKQVKQKSYYSEEILGRLWVIHQRIGKNRKNNKIQEEVKNEQTKN